MKSYIRLTLDTLVDIPLDDSRNLPCSPVRQCRGARNHAAGPMTVSADSLICGFTLLPHYLAYHMEQAVKCFIDILR